ncbi:phosphoethanolamine--lipid A transferase [Sinorhizobium sp. BG8]|uniref:phosphoethanolamine transferase n=1 Tax=Sinorhizobium sp. BG8 TaxID=2613773 RepID=UPI001FEFB2D4|nr:phosphoethanolamine--lipid A transferase [Sinorhizobium sp. BG8]
MTLSIAVALYVLAATNLSFWEKAWFYLEGQPLALALLATGIVTAFVAMFVTVSVKYLIKPLFIVLVLASAAGAWFTDRFGVIIDPEMIRNAAETTSAEAGHLITPGFLWHMAIFGLLPSALIASVRIVHRSFPQKVKWNLAVILPCLAVFAIAGLSQASTFASVSREHRDWFATLNPVVPISSVIRYLGYREAERHLVVKELGTDAHLTSPVASSRKPRVTIIVAGETARAENFSLGGYGRLTNPELAGKDIVYFPNTTSCGTATAVSIPCMFSVYPRASYSHRKGLETETLLDVLSHAGVHAEWWDNNTGSKGVADRVTYVSMPDLNDPRFCRDNECEDGILLDRLDGWLDGIKQDSVLVLHQMGSHGPAYYLRYPEAYRRFTPECRSAEFSKCSREEIVNAYDNTILYTDHVLATIIEKLQAREDHLSPSMIYMSDHGESLGEFGLYLHGAPYMIAPSQQTHVPFLLWLGKDMQASVDVSCLAAKSGADYSHDNLFHTVLGMADVETTVRDTRLDVLSSCRRNVSS